MPDTEALDVLIVGAGFSGIHALNNLRKHGFNVKIYEAGSTLGGTWYWNNYPGARVDCEYHTYQFSQAELWQNYEWNERFPGRDGMQDYFHHIDKQLNLSKDIQYNTRVASASFCDSRKQWLVTTEANESIWARYLLLCIGFSARRYTPAFKGLDTFTGERYHTSAWPENGVELKGKRVAVIGTGASGVQVIQEIAPEVGHLTVYQRTPNLALPMRQYTAEDFQLWKERQALDLKEVFQARLKTFGGMYFDFIEKNTAEQTPEERRIFYEGLFQDGALSFWLATYKDTLFNKEANDSAYSFWCEKTRARINDPVKKDILAPITPPHAFGTKRPSLEQRYYEVYNQDNVDIINISQSPIIEVTEHGIRTEKEGIVKFDIIILATGFDSLTGGILDIKIENGKGGSIQEKWKNGVKANLGMTCAGFPNMFYFYGPQAPTAFSNGPTCAEVQGNWVTDLLVYMKEQKKTRIEATTEAEEKWKESIDKSWNVTLFPGTESWYQGSNIPGKKIEPLNYAGGMPSYIAALGESASKNYEGFVLV